LQQLQAEYALLMGGPGLAEMQNNLFLAPLPAFSQSGTKFAHVFFPGCLKSFRHRQGGCALSNLFLVGLGQAGAQNDVASSCGRQA
jgi:hypothetical protein